MINYFEKPEDGRKGIVWERQGLPTIKIDPIRLIQQLHKPYPLTKYAVPNELPREEHPSVLTQKIVKEIRCTKSPQINQLAAGSHDANFRDRILGTRRVLSGRADKKADTVLESQSERPISRSSKYQTTPHEKQFAVRLNRYRFHPLDFIQTQGIFPSSFSNMKFQQLLFPRPPPHQHKDPMLTPIDAVDLALLDGHSLSIKRFA